MLKDEWVTAETSPSLALVKYWGKQQRAARNIPATGSVAVGLSDLSTLTYLRPLPADEGDRIQLGGRLQNPERFAPVLRALQEFVRKQGGSPPPAVEVNSENSFPTAAGLASSSSGLAALVLAYLHASRIPYTLRDAAKLARIGSGSASRSVFGGFTILPAGSEAAEPLFDKDHWPELRILILVMQSGPKRVSSRDAMELARETSPYYPAWCADSLQQVAQGRDALGRRLLPELGAVMRRSYLRMFATMFSADPPVIYWLPESVAAIHACASLREHGYDAWETMDAGAQVKVLTTEEQVGRVRSGLTEAVPGALIYTSRPAGPPLVNGTPVAPRGEE